MSLEDRIETLTVAVNNLIVALGTKTCEGKPAKKQEAKKGDPQPAPKEEPVDTQPTAPVGVAPEQKGEASAPVTMADVKPKFLKLYGKNATKAAELVKSFGVEKLTPELITERGAEVLAAIKKELDA